MANANVHEFSNDNWQAEVVGSSIPVLVDFWAPWCPPCRALAPTIDKVADSFAGKVKVGKVNVDDNQELAERYRIEGIPALLVFKGGDQPAEKIVGAVPERELVNVLNRVVG